MFRSGITFLRRLLWPWAVGALVVLTLLIMALLAANGVDTTVTDTDRAVIAHLDVDDQCGELNSYPAELNCIEAVQEALFSRHPQVADAFRKGETGHRIADYDARGYGSCYDRATFIEQALRHYGFDVRRVAIFEAQSMPLKYLKPGISSHALSEVKTSRGWMLVESLEPMLGVDEDGVTYSIADLREGLKAGTIDDETFDGPISGDFFEGRFIYVYGLYSRHGYFFEPHLPVPEVDWSKFRIGW
jgi:hypothetical protein